MRVDGKLDEAIYGRVHPASGFIQMEPQAGQPGSEKTEVWVFYDKDNVYVSFRVWESQPERRIVNELTTRVFKFALRREQSGARVLVLAPAVG